MTTEPKKTYIDSASIQHAAYARNEFRVTVPAKTDVSELLREDYWRTVAERFRAGDKLEVIADDLSFYAEYLVTAADRRWLRVKQIRMVGIEANEVRHESESEEFDVLHRGPRGWSVKRKSDGTIMVENQAARSDAEKWLDNHYKARRVA